ncbi:MAG: phosphate ABC transporter substrate-binding protein PstS [Nitrososphaerales archaeon]
MKPKKLDRRKFLYAGLGATVAVIGGLAAYFAAKPPEKVVETVVQTQTQTQVQTVKETQVITVEKPKTVVKWPEKLLGGGATFINPLMQKWAYEFQRKIGFFGIDYQSIGSGQGIAKLKDQAVDFAGSDGPLKREDWEALKGVRGGVIHIPITLGADVAAFNLPVKELKLTQELVLKIFDGRIKKWNDEEMVTLNPELKDHDKGILVAYRADRSGTTFVWTDFLGKVSRDKYPTDFSFKIPDSEEDKKRFLGAKGNEGVTEAIKKTENSIGYIELSYAELNQLNHALIQNKRGNYVKASLESIGEAVQSVLENVKLPDPKDDWSKISLIRMDPPGEKAYPVISFSYILVYAENPTEKALALKEFLNWILREGQKYATELKGYIPLPPKAVEFSLKAVDLIR